MSRCKTVSPPSPKAAGRLGMGKMMGEGVSRREREEGFSCS